MTLNCLRFAPVTPFVPALLMALATPALAQEVPSPEVTQGVTPTTGAEPAQVAGPNQGVIPTAEASTDPAATDSAAAPPRKIVLTSAPPPGPEGRNFHYHDGFYLRTTLSFGLYGGGQSAGDDDAQRDVDIDGSGLDVSVLVGGTPSPGLAVGGGLQLGSLLRPDFDEQGDALATRNVGFLLLGPFVDGFPKANGGWHLGGMVGLAGLGETAVSDASAGFGGAAWVGYDTWVGADWSLGGMLRFTALATTGDDPADHSASLLGVSLGLSVLYH